MAEDVENQDTEAVEETPAEKLSPKERRTRERSRHSGEARAQRTPEERQQERDARRRQQASQRKRWRAREAGKDTGERSEPPEAIDQEPGRTRLRQGVVVSDKADKTITVRIDSQRAHRTYGKQIRTTSTLHAHDEQNEANAGDTVRVVESRPLSRTKRWRLVEILERAR